MWPCTQDPLGPGPHKYNPYASIYGSGEHDQSHDRMYTDTGEGSAAVSTWEKGSGFVEGKAEKTLLTTLEKRIARRLAGVRNSFSTFHLRPWTERITLARSAQL